MQQMQVDLDDARRQLQDQSSNGKKEPRHVPSHSSSSVDELAVEQCQELQRLLQMAHEENVELRRQVEEQGEEIALLEGNVLGALRDIRDEDTTGKRRAGAANSRRPQQRSISQPSKVSASSASPGPADRRSTPPRRPGEVRRLKPQSKGGDSAASGFIQISS